MTRDIDESSENVLSEWSRRVEGEEDASDDGDVVDDAPLDDAPLDDAPLDENSDSSLETSEQHPAEPQGDSQGDSDAQPAWGTVQVVPEPADTEPEPEPRPVPTEPALADKPMPGVMPAEHGEGGLEVPDGYAVLEGEAVGGRRAVGVVVSRFNAAVTTRLLERALAELEETGVAREAITVVVVPGAFELPLAATALAKTRRFACIVALGCVIRGETPHFDYVAGEAASGLQLAALETGVPVSFGVLTLESSEQADARIEKGAEAVRTALEMADVFAQLRAAVANS